MLDYCENEHNCRRQELFKDFDDYTSLTLPESACKCCDICNKTCKCDECNYYYCEYPILHKNNVI